MENIASGVLKCRVNNKANHLVSLISIVDDDRSIREATTSLLKSNGFRTAVYSSAEEFLNSSHRAETQCLILDIQMPGMNGLELQQRLAAEDCRIPIIFITAHGDGKIRNQAIQGGAIEFLTKPFCEEALLRAIHLALEREN